jgi:hypothetical protein
MEINIVPNSTPIVLFESGKNRLLRNRASKFVFPTPDSPIKTILRRKSGSSVFWGTIGVPPDQWECIGNDPELINFCDQSGGFDRNVHELRVDLSIRRMIMILVIPESFTNPFINNPEFVVLRYY